jgi:hypothetical protein
MSDAAQKFCRFCLRLAFEYAYVLVDHDMMDIHSRIGPAAVKDSPLPISLNHLKVSIQPASAANHLVFLDKIR